MEHLGDEYGNSLFTGESDFPTKEDLKRQDAEQIAISLHRISTDIANLVPSGYENKSYIRKSIMDLVKFALKVENPDSVVIREIEKVQLRQF